MNHKFKLGDRLRVIKDVGCHYMEVGVVDKVWNHPDNLYYLDFGNNKKCTFEEEVLENESKNADTTENRDEQIN